MSAKEGDLFVADVVAPDIPESDNLDMYFVSDEELGAGGADSENDQEVECSSQSILRSVEHTLNDIDGFSNLSVCVCDGCASDLVASEEHAPILAVPEEYAPDQAANVSGECAPDQAANGEYTPNLTFSGEYIPDLAVSDEYAPDQAANVSGECAPDQAANGEYSPSLAVSDEYAPDQEANDESKPYLTASEVSYEDSTDLTLSDVNTPFVRAVEPERDVPMKEARAKDGSHRGGDMLPPSKLTNWRRNIFSESFSGGQVLSERDTPIMEANIDGEMQPSPHLRNVFSETFPVNELEPDRDAAHKLRNKLSDTLSVIEAAPVRGAQCETRAMDESHSDGDNRMRPLEGNENSNIEDEINSNLKIRLLSLLKHLSPTSDSIRLARNMPELSESSDAESSDCEFLDSDAFEGSKPAKMRNIDGKKIAGANAMNDIEGASNLPAAECFISAKSSVSEMEPQRNGEVRGKVASHSGGGMPPMPKLKLRSVDNTKNDKEGHSSTKDESESVRKMQLPLQITSSGTNTKPEDEDAYRYLKAFKAPTSSLEEQTLPYDRSCVVGRGSVDELVPSLLKPQQSRATRVKLRREKARGEIRDITDEGAVGGSRKQDLQLRKGKGERELEKMSLLFSESSGDETIDLGEINETFESDEGSKAAKWRNIIRMKKVIAQGIPERRKQKAIVQRTPERKKKAIAQGTPGSPSETSEGISEDENDCSKILKNMRIKVEFQYIEKIDQMNNKIENIKQISDKIQERELEYLKSKQGLEKDNLVRKSNHEKVKLEQKKIELEKQIAKTNKMMKEQEKQALKDKEGMDRRHKQEAKALEAKIKDENNEKEANLVKIRDELMKDMNNYGNAAFPDDVEKLESARGVLECPICMELMKPPTRIWMCPSNNLVCETCRDRLEGKLCPSCRTVRVNVRATVAENFAAVLFKE